MYLILISFVNNRSKLETSRHHYQFQLPYFFLFYISERSFNVLTFFKLRRNSLRDALTLCLLKRSARTRRRSGSWLSQLYSSCLPFFDVKKRGTFEPWRCVGKYRYGLVEKREKSFSIITCRMKCAYRRESITGPLRCGAEGFSILMASWIPVDFVSSAFFTALRLAA